MKRTAEGSQNWGYGYRDKTYVKNNDTPRKKTAKEIAQELAAIGSLPVLAYPDRSISKETMEYFGVRTGLSQEDRTPAEHYYPYTDPEGKVCGYKCRILPKDFESKGCIGKIKGFFGKDKCYGNNFLIIVEGEQDALAAHEMMRKLKPERNPYNVVSLPTGTDEEGALHPLVRKELEWLSAFKKIVLCLDMDKPGQATAATLADYLCSHTDVSVVSLPLKDSAAMLEAGRAKEWGQAINNAKKHVSDQIITGSDCFDELMKPIDRGIHYSFIPKTSVKLNGFRTGEVTGILAPPNVGKSTFMRQMKYELLVQTEEPVGAFFLEERVKKTAQAVLAYHCGLPLNVFRKNPELADKYKVEEARETLLPRLHMFEHKMKTLTDDYLERKIEYMVKAVGCRRVFLDHLSFIISGREGQNERKEIDNLLTRLARSVEDWDYELYIVSHIKRPDNFKLQRKEYPYWNTVNLTDGRGSGAIEQLMHKIIALENQVMNPEDDNGRGLLRSRVLRDREWGASGMGDYLRWDERGQFVPVEVEV